MKRLAVSALAAILLLAPFNQSFARGSHSSGSHSSSPRSSSSHSYTPRSPSSHVNSTAPVHVKGYYKKNGTYVAPHYRSHPDKSYNNNWSTKGNVNPYTGKPGTKNPTPDDRPPPKTPPASR